MTDPKVPDEERAERIAEIRQLADWLEAHPEVPTPFGVSAWQQLANENIKGALSAVDGLALVRKVAVELGIKPDESARDHTKVTVKFGRAEYSLLTWHKAGRPGEPDPRDAELARLRAELAELQRHGIKPMSVDEIGQTYSREADDPKPVSPAPGAAVHFRLVAGESACSLNPLPPTAAATDEVEQVTCGACRRSLKLTGLAGSRQADDCPTPLHHYAMDYETACGRSFPGLPEDHGFSQDRAVVDCKDCLTAVAPVSEAR